MATTIERHPRLAGGVELLGEFPDSGFSDPPSLVRRGDGQVLQLPRVLYLVAESLDGRRSPDDIAARVSEAIGRGIDGDGVRFLVEEKLAPIGLVAGAEPQRLVRADPMLALRLRVAVVPAHVVQRLARALSPLFLPTVVVGVLAGVVALDVWAFAVHGLAQALHGVLADPLLLLVLLGLVVVSATFHECGHAAACHYGGARPGPMGVGIYLVWPAFYTDVTDSYRLRRRDRLRTDLGGVYFNCIVILACGLGYLATGFAPLLLFVPLQHLEILHQLLPVLRLDGYLIVGDLAGVPDILARIKPTLLSLVPGRPVDDSVRGLRPRARLAVTAYVLIIVPLLLAALGLLLVSMPRILGTAERSFRTQLHVVHVAFGGGDPAIGVLGCLQLTVLLLPATGILLGLARSGRRLAATARRSEPQRRAAILTGVAVCAAILGYAWWPSSAYRPVAAGDSGTLQHGFDVLGRLVTGRLTSGRPAAPPQKPPAATPPPGAPAVAAHSTRHRVAVERKPATHTRAGVPFRIVHVWRPRPRRATTQPTRAATTVEPTTTAQTTPTGTAPTTSSTTPTESTTTATTTTTTTTTPTDTTTTTAGPPP